MAELVASAPPDATAPGRPAIAWLGKAAVAALFVAFLWVSWNLYALGEAVLAGLVELFGGLAILFGYRTRIAALALAAFTLAATGIAHLDFADPTQLLFIQKNLSITGGLLILAIFGAGALSIDARRD